MLTTFEWKVLHRSDACQNTPKSKGYLPKTSEFTMQKVELEHQPWFQSIWNQPLTALVRSKHHILPQKGYGVSSCFQTFWLLMMHHLFYPICPCTPNNFQCPKYHKRPMRPKSLHVELNMKRSKWQLWGGKGFICGRVWNERCLGHLSLTAGRPQLDSNSKRELPTSQPLSLSDTSINNFAELVTFSNIPCTLLPLEFVG